MGVQPSAAPLASSTQALWAIISHWMTPGTTGLPGKCPWRKYSSPRMWHLPWATPSISSTSSTSSMGSRWGRIFLISSLFITKRSSCSNGDHLKSKK